jgi:hypothetical protein
MYISGMSKRTQVTFTDQQHALLIDESNRTGLPMAELVRRAVDGTFRPMTRRPLVRGFELSLGLWRGSMQPLRRARSYLGSRGSSTATFDPGGSGGEARGQRDQPA